METFTTLQKTLLVLVLTSFLFFITLTTSEETVTNEHSRLLVTDSVPTVPKYSFETTPQETSENNTSETTKSEGERQDTHTPPVSVSLLPPIETPLITPPAPTPPVTQTPLKTTTELNTLTRKALVNILCTSRSGGLFRPASGSGVIIDPRGIILTNAHVAQYFLIKDYPVEDNLTCTIRTGSPAINTYHARLIYISQNWIYSNRTNLTETSSFSNGSDDFALLLITDVTSPNGTLPETFDYIIPNLEPGLPEPETPVLLGGYAAGFLSGISIQTDLYASTSVVNTKETISYTDTGTVDLFGLGGSIVAQQGSSGGGVIRFDDATLQGIISLSTLTDSTADRNLLAISIDHIRRSLIAEIFIDLEDILASTGSLEAFADSFDTKIRQSLVDILVAELE